MSSVAVVANSSKNHGGGLPELRRILQREGISDPIWHEVKKARRVESRVAAALDEGAELVFVWGGDGSVRAALGPFVGRPAALAILPAGTANLLAVNLGVPRDLHAAVAVGLRGCLLIESMERHL